MNKPGGDSSPKSRPARRRKTFETGKPRKRLLLEEIGDDLIGQLYATSIHSDHMNGCHLSCVSVIDHLRSDVKDDHVSSSASSSNYSSQTAQSTSTSTSTPTTSFDGHEPIHFTSETTKLESPHPNSEPALVSQEHGNQADVFSLDDFATMTAIEYLAAKYGRVAHMGILDRSYRFFVNKSRTAALSFKIQNSVAIVAGDPLCPPSSVPELLAEFTKYRKRHHWGIAFMSVSEAFLQDYARPNNWTTIRFGTERVLNPKTNEVLLESSGKRITTQNRQLLNKSKGGITLHVYAPAVHGTDHHLQSTLISIYDTWRAHRNEAASPQAFITVYDPFALPSLMTFIYTRDSNNAVNGFAALRRLGSDGYHVDPCIASPGSSKGISDLLLVAAMALLNRAGVSYLGFGFEPLHALSRDDIVGMPGPMRSFTRELYGHAFQRLPIGGKKAYHDKFRPDLNLDQGLYLVFPSGFPGPRVLMAMTHMANISLRKIFWADVRGWVGRKEAEGTKEGSERQIGGVGPQQP
ncbi:unnamed protein product [Penicillium olsonii]|nr:unnamed protein product [Penicillium olsonii]